MASGQGGGRRHAQADVVADEDLSGGGSGVVGGATAQDSQGRCCVGAGCGGERRRDDRGEGRGGGVGGRLEEGGDSRGGSVCQLIDLVKGGGRAGQVEAFMNT